MAARETKTLIRWLIEQIDGEKYRAGEASGYRHPKVDKKFLALLGGRESLLSQARAIERDPVLGAAGQIWFDWRDMGADISQIHYSVTVMPELCRREGMEDPRDRQLRYITTLREWQERAGAKWLIRYYQEEIERLEKPMEKPIFSARVFGGVKDAEMTEEKLMPSKIFRKKYESKVIHILEHYSSDCVEGMSGDEILAAHGILSYAQTLEWKGPLVYAFDGGAEMYTSVNIYGTIINARTLEHARPIALPGVKRIFTIENKANYEKLKFREDELYIFCHGFFSPKEVRFLKKLVIAAGAGVPVEEEKRRKIEKLEAGELEELKNCILERSLEIEQELLAE